ncbi:MAG: hypothetical protein IJW59_00645 [Clostridia bacterium]|nr:hypothetical protein [Clostridia bacterium]
MYKISQLKLPVDFDENNLQKYISKKIKVDELQIRNAKLLKLSIDARDKLDLCYKATIAFESSVRIDLKKLKNVEQYESSENVCPSWTGKKKNIVIVGSGPSGLFAGLRLVESGASVTILERGYDIPKRKQAVERLMKDGVLDETSNIQFGEGGAGTFSDGKLNTGIKSPHIEYVLQSFHKFGASENILYDARPHIGTDVLSSVIVSMRKYLQERDCNVLFEHKFVGFECNGGSVSKVVAESPRGKAFFDCDVLILAIGHSSRDTIRWLYDNNIQFVQKPFSLGYRIEHLQSDINKGQYGVSEDAKKLPPADYHLVEKLSNGRVVYSFCMCPGGVVVPAMSECGSFVTNGMSYNARDGVNANSALLVNVNTTDFPSIHPLSGIELQEKWERFAYKKVEDVSAVVQRVGDFLQGKPTKTIGKVVPSITPKFTIGSVEDMLPKFVVDSIKEAIPKLDKKLKGFADEDAILTGIETRSSAPYQVVRNVDMMTGVGGVYMIGEGAGFAGGIVSSAVEGIKCADIIIKKNN